MYKWFFLVLAPILSGPAMGQTKSVIRPRITGLSHLTLYADDITKSRDFYTSMLGWYPAYEYDPKSGIRFYANHSQYIELVSPPQQHLADRLDIVAFSTSNADALRKYLGSHGVAVPESVEIGADGSKSFLTQDPEGNKIEFTQIGSHALAMPTTASQRLSTHIMHAGYMVRDRAALDHFYKDLLGFHLYWQGGFQRGHIDWVMMQVPNGSDWIEYMLYLPASPSRGQLGSANHFSPGIVSVAKLQERLEQRGWTRPPNQNPQVLGVDGKLQLDLVDPDGTRVEFMELHPIVEPCCAPFTGVKPRSSSTW